MERFQYEALKRRVSYLAVANHLQITLLKGSLVDPLYGWTDLTTRPETEKVHSGFKRRSDDDTPGRLEKDFQTWLFGRGLYKKPDIGMRRTNERLALFGPDFVGIGKLKSVKRQNGYGVEREFPTGAFNAEVKENNRILPTEFVDLVTLNRNGELAVASRLRDRRSGGFVWALERKIQWRSMAELHAGRSWQRQIPHHRRRGI